MQKEGYKDYWRVRVGDWRVLYIINDTAKVVSVTGSHIAARSTNKKPARPPLGVSCSRKAAIQLLHSGKFQDAS